jgi:RND family efflux transporter, MFP subunit
MKFPINDGFGHRLCVATMLVTLLSACSRSAAPDNDQSVHQPATASPAASVSAPPQSMISAGAAELSGIRLREAGPARIRQTLTVYGAIAPDAYRTQQVRARYPGLVREVTREPGQAVSQGDLLLSIESSDSLASYAVRSPITGTVLERHVNPGEAVDASRVLMVVSDLKTVWAQFQVFARDLGRVRGGMPVAIHGVYGDVEGRARLDYVAPAGEVDSQSVVARATLPNRDGRWVPGQFVTGAVVVAEVDAPVAVVPQALQQLDGKPVVFVRTDEGFRPSPVEIGLRDARAVEIKAGLIAGVRYAADNSYLIKADLLKAEGGED